MSDNIDLRYLRGKIYKIINDDFPNKIYIGSTIQLLCARHASHKKDIIKGKSCECRDMLNGNEKIILIKNFPCNTKEELRAEERKYIESMDCVNKHIPNRTAKEWYQDNKNSVKEKVKKYALEHKEKVKEYKTKYRLKNKNKATEKITCECGAVVSKRNISSHKKTNKHTNNLKK